MSSESRPEREREREPRNGPEEQPPPGTGADAQATAPEAEREPAEPESGSESEPDAERKPESAPGPEPGPEAAPDSAPDPSPQPEAPVYADRCYRSPGALAGGVLLLLLGLWLGTDALINGDNHTRLTAVFGLVLAVPLVVAFTLRPAVYAGRQRMRVRNPFRTITVPWGSVEAVRAGYSSEVVADGTKYQLWSIPVSLRARKRAARRTERAERAAARGGAAVAAAPARPMGLFGLGGVPGGDDVGERRAPSDQAIDELRGLAADNGKDPAAQGEVTVRWAYEIAAPALAGAVALAVLLAMG
ncbi:PH domain-containing protein [Streptomyces winkii]|uniref:PH domain-containing protein n=1 Tax=Streptomyces winkii TaxID=3051178 RepID=UPI0028D4F2D2|nr:PH domain-containing protein [Streptomyces sp. DSM 40971]